MCIYINTEYWPGYSFKGLSDASVVSLTKKEHDLAVYFLWILMKSLVLISDE